MRAKKALGQNFLVDKNIVERIVAAVGASPNDVVVEIGPGQGALTEKLVDCGAKVIAIEFDRDLVPLLENRFGDTADLRMVNEDALRVDFEELLKGTGPAGAKLVANLPYNISTPILQRLIQQRQLFSSMVLMFQREVVQRITAMPGTKERGYLTVLVENAFHVERLFEVPPSAFRPVPRVWSAVTRLVPRTAHIRDQRTLEWLASHAFAHKRKTILNNLRSVTGHAAETLADAGIDAQRRAETLTIEEWSALVAAIKKPGDQ